MRAIAVVALLGIVFPHAAASASSRLRAAEGLMSWLRDQHGVDVSAVHVAIPDNADSPNNVELITTRELALGEVAVSVPLYLTMHRGVLMAGAALGEVFRGVWRSLATSGRSDRSDCEFCMLAAFVAAHASRGNESAWFPYLRALPRVLTHGLAIEPAHIEELRTILPHHAHVITTAAQAAAKCEDIADMLAHHPAAPEWLADALDGDALAWAFTTVVSRGVRVRRLGAVVVPPLVDMANHAGAEDDEPRVDDTGTRGALPIEFFDGTDTTQERATLADGTLPRIRIDSLSDAAAMRIRAPAALPAGAPLRVTYGGDELSLLHQAVGYGFVSGHTSDPAPSVTLQLRWDVDPDALLRRTSARTRLTEEATDLLRVVWNHLNRFGRNATQGFIFTLRVPGRAPAGSVEHSANNSDAPRSGHTQGALGPARAHEKLLPVLRLMSLTASDAVSVASVASGVQPNSQAHCADGRCSTTQTDARARSRGDDEVIAPLAGVCLSVPACTGTGDLPAAGGGGAAAASGSLENAEPSNGDKHESRDGAGLPRSKSPLEGAWELPSQALARAMAEVEGEAQPQTPPPRDGLAGGAPTTHPQSDHPAPNVHTPSDSASVSSSAGAAASHDDSASRALGSDFDPNRPLTRANERRVWRLLLAVARAGELAARHGAAFLADHWSGRGPASGAVRQPCAIARALALGDQESTCEDSEGGASEGASGGPTSSLSSLLKVVASREALAWAELVREATTELEAWA